MTTQPGAPAGWYPVDPHVERWWDGFAWGQQVRPIAQPPQQPRRAITYSPKRTNHLLHLVLTILTGGLWGLFVWLPITLFNGFRREKSVTRYR